MSQFSTVTEHTLLITLINNKIHTSTLLQGYDWIVSTTCYNTNDEASFCKSAKSTRKMSGGMSMSKSAKSAASWEYTPHWAHSHNWLNADERGVDAR